METLQGIVIVCVLSIAGWVAIIDGVSSFTKGIKEDSAPVTFYGLIVMLSGCAIIGTFY